MRLFFIHFWLLTFCVVAPVMGESKQEYQSQIKQIAQEIKKISKNLNANKKLLKSEQHKLLEIEQEISILKQNKADTEQKLTQQKQLIADIEQETNKVKGQQADNVDAVKTLLAQQYINGEPNYLKMLLNQQNPYAVGRLSHYYQYYQQAHSEKLSELDQQLTQLQTLQSKNKQAVAELASIQQQQRLQQQQLEQAQTSRKKVISKLDTKVENSSTRLKKLRQNRDRLNTLLKQIAKQAKEMRRLEQERIEQQKKQDLALKKPEKVTPPRPVAKPVKGGFKKQKGRLKLPATGKVKYKFGSRLAASGMRAEGMLIETTKNQKVQSIFRGRVVFADWLKGYGLLIIVDHGDDHISLYGHNQLLYKNVGDMVDTNEIIAKAGVTGGLKKNGVYFEIRHHATPINPSLWCK